MDQQLQCHRRSAQSAPQSDCHLHLEYSTIFFTNLLAQNWAAESSYSGDLDIYGIVCSGELLLKSLGSVRTGTRPEPSIHWVLNFLFLPKLHQAAFIRSLKRDTRYISSWVRNKELKKVKYRSHPAPAAFRCETSASGPEDKRLLCVWLGERQASGWT